MTPVVIVGYLVLLVGMVCAWAVCCFLVWALWETDGAKWLRGRWEKLKVEMAGLYARTPAADPYARHECPFCGAGCGCGQFGKSEMRDGFDCTHKCAR